MIINFMVGNFDGFGITAAPLVFGPVNAFYDV